MKHDLAATNDCDCPQPPTEGTDNSEQIEKPDTALYLQKINWRYGEVNFNMVNRQDLKGDKHYSEITIATKGADGINRIIKSFSLFTSYLEAAGINTSNADYYLNYNYRRLKLDSVGIYGMPPNNSHETARGNLESPPYKFGYNYDDNFLSSHLPHKDSKQKDLWGYYNGVISGTEIPLLGTNSTSGRYKVSNINHDTGGTYSHKSEKAYAQAYLLNNITYPTGGSTSFSYELHDFNFLGKKTTGGGLRLAEKKVIESNGNVINTIYTYKEADEINTSGYANNIPAYGYLCSASNDFNSVSDADWYKSSSRLDNPVGAEIGYSRVVESIFGRGKTEYLFTSSKEYPDQLHSITTQDFNFCNDYIGKYDRFPFVNNTSNAHKRGLLKSANHYKNDGTTLVKGLTNYYKFKPINTEPINFKLNLISGTSPWIDVYTESNIYSEFVYNEKTVTFLDGVTKTETYTYDENNFDLRDHYLFMSEADANPAKAYVTKYLYAYDFFNNPGINKLKTQNRAEIIEQNQYVFEGDPNNPQTTDFTRIDGTKYRYDAVQDDFGPFVSQVSRYEMTWGNNVNTDPNQWESQYKIHHYNWELAKPTKITDKGWNDTTYLTYTNTGKIDNIKYKDFVNEYDYNPATDLLSRFTAPDGQTIEYSYDEFLRLDSINARNKKQTTKFEYSYQPNYITTHKKYYANSSDDIEMSYTDQHTFDGLGRPDSLIKVAYAYSSGANVVNRITYNTFGLKEKEIDPLNGEMIYAYHQNPLNRIHTITDAMGFVTTKTYGTNATNEVDGYDANMLQKNTTTDPDDIETATFTDKLGRVVMTMVKKDNNSSKTYTLYDDKSRVVKILPPGTAETDVDLIYTYTYDGADNILSKKLPDKDAIEYRYNARDLQIGMRDANITANNMGWLSNQYDDYGRLTKQGFGSKPGEIKELLIENFYDKNEAQNTIDPSNPIYIGKLHKKEVKVLNGLSGSDKLVGHNYALDEYGRMFVELKTNHLGRLETFTYSYNMADQALSTAHTYNGNTSTATNEYDNKGRLIKTYHRVNGVDDIQTAEIADYSLKDELLSKTLGNNAQTIDYTYNANSWLTKINNVNATTGTGPIICTSTSVDCPNDQGENNRSQSSEDLFALDIRYNNPAYGNARKNGNIAELHWQVSGRKKEYYNFTYDFLNRLKTANNLDNKYNTTYAYDARGNINTLTRKGLTAKNNCCFKKQTIDNLAYTYYPGTNRLKHITDAVSSPACPSEHHQANTTNQSGSYGAQIELSSDAQLPNNTNISFSAGQTVELKDGFETKGGDLYITTGGCPKPNLANNSNGALALSESYGYAAYTGSNTTFDYDANGNLITDNAKGLSIQYNHLNLPYKVTKNANNSIEWLYTAEGQKLQKKTTLNGTANTKDYLGDMELYNGKLQVAYHNEGRYAVESDQWEYNLKDHLGNVRIVFTEDDNGMVDIVQENHYYPFGMQMNGNWAKTQTVKNDYLYNGKELNTDLGLNWSDYGFRFYDAAIGRFTGVDPISDQFPWVSTYNYAENKPINSIDLWGLQSYPMYGGEANDIHRGSAQFQKDNPKTAAAIAIGFIAAPVAFAIATEAGPATTVAFVGNEIKDEVLSQLSGGTYDLFDLSKQLKNLPEYVGEISKNIGKIKDHLSDMHYDEGNKVMLDRLEKISKGELDATDTDINFYNHELTERDYMETGFDYDTAHKKALEDANIKNEPGVNNQLYTDDALKASENYDRANPEPHKKIY